MVWNCQTDCELTESSANGPSAELFLQPPWCESSETGLYYYRARYYDPSAGRFLSEDPMQFTAGGNFYRYAYNNAALWSDPTGMMPSDGPSPAIMIPSTRVPGSKLWGDVNPFCRKGRNIALDFAMLEESIDTRWREIYSYRHSKIAAERLLADDPGHEERIDVEEEAKQRCLDSPKCPEPKPYPFPVQVPEWKDARARRAVATTGVVAVGGVVLYYVVTYGWLFLL